MLSEDDARTLAQADAGTPIGELLRRYWMPIAAASELEERPIRPVRLLGEDLVVFKNGEDYGLVSRRCPHRQFDLSFATVEPRGIRCSFHGWLFDGKGACLEQPLEQAVHPESSFRERVRTAAYPVQSKAGLLWAYLGPAPAPLLPDWAGFYSPGYTVVSLLQVPCHWLQIMEGFYDPVHVEWLHDRWSFHLHGRAVPPRRPRHTGYRWLDFVHGVIFQRKLAGSDEWLADRTVIFPNVDGAAGQGWYLTWVVPVDDTHTLLVYRLTLTSWKTPLGQVMVPAHRGAPQERVPAYRVHASLDPEARPSRDLGSHLVSQDVVSWLGLGRRVDRTREHLGETDRGVAMFRRKLLAEARAAAQGSDPQGVIRDPKDNRRITLPGARKGYGIRGEGLPGLTGEGDVMLRAFLPVGIPDEIRQEIEQAMSALVAGLRPDWWKRRAD